MEFYTRLRSCKIHKAGKIAYNQATKGTKQMWHGEILQIGISPSAGQLIQIVDQVHAVPGKGLEGDRYFSNKGTYEPSPDGSRQVTLIESEALAALSSETGIQLKPGESRRNLVTRGVPLNHLVGKEFNVGTVRLRGVRLCEPCKHLVEITGQAGVLPGLTHRGGLRAEILSDGIIQVGDSVSE